MVSPSAYQEDGDDAFANISGAQIPVDHFETSEPVVPDLEMLPEPQSGSSFLPSSKRFPDGADVIDVDSLPDAEPMTSDQRVSPIVKFENDEMLAPSSETTTKVKQEPSDLEFSWEKLGTGIIELFDDEDIKQEPDTELQFLWSEMRDRVIELPDSDAEEIAVDLPDIAINGAIKNGLGHSLLQKRKARLAFTPEQQAKLAEIQRRLAEKARVKTVTAEAGETLESGKVANVNAQSDEPDPQNEHAWMHESPSDDDEDATARYVFLMPSLCAIDSQFPDLTYYAKITWLRNERVIPPLKMR